MPLCSCQSQELETETAKYALWRSAGKRKVANEACIASFLRHQTFDVCSAFIVSRGKKEIRRLSTINQLHTVLVVAIQDSKEAKTIAGGEHGSGVAWHWNPTTVLMYQASFVPTFGQITGELRYGSG